METEALDFLEAVETLADRYGVREREEDDLQAEQRRRRRERLMALLDRAAGYYAAYLWDSGEAAPARSYLLGRGLFGGGAARVQGRLLPERLGSHAPGSPARRLQRGGAGCCGAGSTRLERVLSTTASAAGSCFRSPIRVGGSSDSAPAR